MTCLPRLPRLVDGNSCPSKVWGEVVEVGVDMCSQTVPMPKLAKFHPLGSLGSPGSLGIYTAFESQAKVQASSAILTSKCVFVSRTGLWYLGRPTAVVHAEPCVTIHLLVFSLLGEGEGDRGSSTGGSSQYIGCRANPARRPSVYDASTVTTAISH